MKHNFCKAVISSLLLTGLMSCSDDEGSSLNLNLSGLEDLGTSHVYEGWIIVDGAPVSTGIFSVNSSGVPSRKNFSVDKDDLDKASTFVLTIEPSPDQDPAPSKIHLLAGDFINNTASMSISHQAALNADFTNVAGSYILATPTDGAGNNEKSGLWFLDNSSGSPSASLSLPALPEGWIYEAWAVINGIPVSTGTFVSGTAADNAAPYSGMMGAPPFPGEDFLINAPDGLSFPTDLSGGLAVISIEPVPDNSSAPFALKPLLSTIPVSAAEHTVYPLSQNLMFPSGTVLK